MCCPTAKLFAATFHPSSSAFLDCSLVLFLLVLAHLSVHTQEGFQALNTPRLHTPENPSAYRRCINQSQLSYILISRCKREGRLSWSGEVLLASRALLRWGIVRCLGQQRGGCFVVILLSRFWYLDFFVQLRVWMQSLNPLFLACVWGTRLDFFLSASGHQFW